MDTEAVIRRAPELALIDELAHTNAAGLAPPQALPGHRGGARRRHRRHLHRQRPAPREPERHRLRADRRARARDVPRPPAGRGRRGGAGRPRAAGAAGAAAGRQGLPAEPGRDGARELLPHREPGVAAPARAARAVRGRRGPARDARSIDPAAQQAILDRILVLVDPAAELAAAAAPRLALGPAAGRRHRRAVGAPRRATSLTDDADRRRWPRCGGWRRSWARTSSRRSRRRDRRRCGRS